MSAGLRRASALAAIVAMAVGGAKVVDDHTLPGSGFSAVATVAADPTGPTGGGMGPGGMNGSQFQPPQMPSSMPDYQGVATTSRRWIKTMASRYTTAVVRKRPNRFQVSRPGSSPNRRSSPLMGRRYLTTKPRLPTLRGPVSRILITRHRNRIRHNSRNRANSRNSNSRTNSSRRTSRTIRRSSWISSSNSVSSSVSLRPSITALLSRCLVSWLLRRAVPGRCSNSPAAKLAPATNVTAHLNRPDRKTPSRRRSLLTNLYRIGKSTAKRPGRQPRVTTWTSASRTQAAI